MKNEMNQNSRSDYRAKRKKTNYILNGLIVIVLLLIIIVAYNIFVSGNDHASSTDQKTSKTEQKQTTTKKDSNKGTTTTKEEDSSKDSDAVQGDKEDSEEASTTETADDSQAVISDGGSTANVVKTIENPSWKPVGTTQAGEHSPVYDTNSVDWQEMLSALSYATGIDQSNMTVYWLGRDKSTSNASVGTVYSKDNQQKYRVFIKWVDGEGWMPTKVEELAVLER